MIGKFRKALSSIRPQFYRPADKHLSPYFRFTDYKKIWGFGILALGVAALLPLIFVTIIHFRLIQKSIDSEIILRTERVTSNARRAVTYFLEEHLNALRFTVNELTYEQLTNSDRLKEILRNLKLGFGGLTDLSVIDHSGIQIAYAGPFKLEGKNYSNQIWFAAAREREFYVSEVFRGYRDLPHVIVTVKSYRPDGKFFILRATLETERLIKTLLSYKTGEYADIFLVNRSGVIQTPSINNGEIFKRITLPIPNYSTRTQTLTAFDRQMNPIILGYAFISTHIADTSFILMVVKQKEGMTTVWRQLHTNINTIVLFSIIAILIVITITCTFMVNKLYLADKEKAETMASAEQTHQLASIGQLAAGVAHEINNPLALIGETAGYIKDLFSMETHYRNDEEILEHIDTILDSVERCGMITRQLLGFARKFDIRIQQVKLKQIISDVLVFHKKETEYRNISVHVDVPENIPEIETDRGKLQQIMINLVNNAFQAMHNGCCLDILAACDGPEKVKISISDNGCGIPQEDLGKVFQPFFTTKKDGKGTGLGLTITYGLVKKLHGDISVTSKEKEGTTFILSLPVRIKEEISDNEGSFSR
jgi:two-component system NtrC family sensor kinase